MKILSDILFDSNTSKEVVTWFLLFRWNMLRCLSGFSTVTKVSVDWNLNTGLLTPVVIAMIPILLYLYYYITITSLKYKMIDGQC